MRRNDPERNLTEERRDYLMGEVYSLMTMHGLKALTMDEVASHLAMSKRTLYELFSSKEELLGEALLWHGRRVDAHCRKVFGRSPDAMTAVITLYNLQKRHMMSINVDFFRDFDGYARSLKAKRREREAECLRQLGLIYARGVEEGVFRPGINLIKSLGVLNLQMESLKRMEEHFPEGMSLAEVYDRIMEGYIRSVATRRGLDIIENKITHNSPE